MNAGKIGVITMTVLLGIYLVFVVRYGIALLSTGETVGIAMGIALLVLPLIGAWVIVRELLFVRNAQRLLAILGAEGGLPVDDLPRLPSGRVVAEAADAEFPRYKAAVEDQPDSWRAWVLLGLAYDASGDRRRARWATREAISIERAS
jgi:hypothetical protein